ncbi:hypothetical protein, partial [Larkinella sp. C7]|uniref:hypothetical protein n=1 Tax=Larkinella sp. C7 TaxID=2576607 RepID=UPI00111150BF
MTHRYLLFFLFISLCSLQNATSQPRLFNASPSAQPGETVGLQGSFGASAKAYFRKGTATTPTALPIQVQSAN